jgi:RNA polymerase sigma factor (sigma-70 family)
MTMTARRNKDLSLFTRAQEGDSSAAHQIIEENIGLVYKCLGGAFHDRDELVVIGMAGILRAIRTFDPEKGAFSTYAMVWIRSALQREGSKIHSDMRWTERSEQLRAEINEVRQSYRHKEHREPTIAEISMATNHSLTVISQNLNRPVTVPTEQTDLIGEDDEYEGSIEAAVDIMAAIAKLPVSDFCKKIVELRFGLRGGVPMTVREIARTEHRSAEMIKKSLETTIAMLADSPGLIGYRP